MRLDKVILRERRRRTGMEDAFRMEDDRRH